MERLKLQFLKVKDEKEIDPEPIPDVISKVGGRAPPTFAGVATPIMVRNGVKMTIEIPDSQL